MMALLGFLYTCVLIIGSVAAFIYALWQAHQGKWAEATFWVALSISFEMTVYRRIGRDLEKMDREL